MPTAASKPIWDYLADSMTAFERQAQGVHDVDVAVIGAGIGGLSAALCALRDGHRVIVLDRQGIGAGETLRTTAHLANALDDRYLKLRQWHGEDGARLAAHSHAAAIDWIERFCAQRPSGCGFRRVPGYLFAHDGDARRLRDEFEAAREAGLAARFLQAAPAGLEALGSAIEFAGQARVDIDALVAELAVEIRELGGRFFRGEVQRIEGGDTVVLELAGQARIRARHAIVATNVPFHETLAVHTKQAAYRTYVVAARCEQESVPDALIWDDGDPYHYVRLVEGRDGDGRYLIVGGEDHKTGQDEDPDVYLRLQLWARERFAGLGEFTHAWSGQILEPADGLAFLGADAGGMRNVYVITGDSGNGITHGVIGGMLIADLIAGRDNPWRELYAPDRKPLRAGATWLRENADVARQYARWLGSRPELAQAGKLAPGAGAVFRDGMHLIAASRGADGALHCFSARCPHLGCAVGWNAHESTWDCPCHGSRFDAASGRVLNGPAASGLEPLAQQGLAQAGREAV